MNLENQISQKKIKPHAMITVDMDGLEDYARCYNFQSISSRRVIYEQGLDRLLELFAKHQIRATFFVIARDVKNYGSKIRKISDLGHEIANHSFSHPVNLRKLAPQKLEEEILGADRVLRDCVGKEIKGFRAPGYWHSFQTLEFLKSAGYWYDSSVFPTFLKPLMNASLLWVSRFKSKNFAAGPLGDIFRKSTPFLLKKGCKNSPSFWELPISVTSLLRIPILSTVHLLRNPEYAIHQFRNLEKKSHALMYLIHPIEMLNFNQDKVDSFLNRQPGLNIPFEKKARHFNIRLGYIREHFESVTSAWFVEHILEKSIDKNSLST